MSAIVCVREAFDRRLTSLWLAIDEWKNRLFENEYSRLKNTQPRKQFLFARVSFTYTHTLRKLPNNTIIYHAAFPINERRRCWFLSLLSSHRNNQPDGVYRREETNERTNFFDVFYCHSDKKMLRSAKFGVGSTFRFFSDDRFAIMLARITYTPHTNDLKNVTPKRTSATLKQSDIVIACNPFVLITQIDSWKRHVIQF